MMLETYPDNVRIDDGAILFVLLVYLVVAITVALWFAIFPPKRRIQYTVGEGRQTPPGWRWLSPQEKRERYIWGDWLMSRRGEIWPAKDVDPDTGIMIIGSERPYFGPEAQDE